MLVLGACPQLLRDDFHNGELLLDRGSDRFDAGAAGSSGAGSSGGASGASGGAAADAGTDGCSNGAQDGGETGVDCGGPCAPCGCTWGPFGAPEPLAVAGLPAGSALFGPALSADGLILFLSSRSTGTQDLYSASRSERGAAFGAATSTAFSTLNTSAHETSPHISADGLRLYFCSEANVPIATGGGDLYLSTRASTTSAFGIPSSLSSINSTALENLAWVSPDELSIFFSSTRANGSGATNLWFAQRSSRRAAFDEPRALNELNTDANDQGPSLSADQLALIFSSDRGGTGSSGQFDIWMTTRASADTPFSPPVVVADLNTAADELDVNLSADGTELLFSSDRGGGAHTLWRSTRSCE